MSPEEVISLQKSFAHKVLNRLIDDVKFDDELTEDEAVVGFDWLRDSIGKRDLRKERIPTLEYFRCYKCGKVFSRRKGQTRKNVKKTFCTRSCRDG